MALTLALGIGVNTAMFSLVYGILIAPLPFAQPERVVVLSEHSTGVDSTLVSPVTYADWTDRNHVFEELAAWRFWENRAIEISPGQVVPVLHVTATPNYFRALGWTPALGRTHGEEKNGSANEAVLSHAVWMRVFGGDRGAIGKTVRVNGTPYVVVGVMPSLHRDPRLGLGDIWTPLHRYNLQQRRVTSFRARYLGVIGRLRPGVRLPQAQAAMSALQAQLAQEATSVAKGFQVRLELLADAAGNRIRPVLTALFVAVLFVLMIACVNVANLMLSRVATRAREYAVRVSIGAQRIHLVRQTLTESLLLSVVGGAAGVALAFSVLQLLKARLAGNISRLESVEINWPVLAFAAVLIVLVSLLFSLAPLGSINRARLHDTLKESGRSSHGTARSRPRSLLVASEVAFAVLLLCSAGLALKSFSKLLRVDPGFAANDRVVADIILPLPDYEPVERRTSYYRELFRRLEQQPGFAGAGAALYFPNRPKVWLSTIWVEDSPVEEGREPIVYYNLFAGDYFKTMGIPLHAGRLPRPEEMWENRRVVLINQTMARQVFPSTDPIGKRFKDGKNGTWFTIIGVVGDVRQRSLDEPPRAEFYLPFSAMPMPFLTVVANSRLPLNSAAQALENAARESAPGLKIENAASLRSLVEGTVHTHQLGFLLIMLFASLSLALAAVGIYGVISHSVAQRTSEVGLRMALGATRGQVLKLIASQAIGTAAWGVIAGLALTALATPAVRTLLYDVSPFDPVVYLGVPIMTLLVVSIACLVPATRAARVDPLVGLRGE